MKTLTLSLIAILWLATNAFAQPPMNPMTLVAQYTGEAANNYFGKSISCGDFNNDGYEDILIGAYGWNDYTGKSYFYLGGPQWPTAPSLTIQGTQINDGYCYCVKNVGDLNADGIPDFIIGQAYYGNCHTGRLDLYWDSPELDTIPDWRHTYYTNYYSICFPEVADSLGDVNGDGYNDFGIAFEDGIITAYSTWIFYGGPQMDTIPDWWCFGGGGIISSLGDINADGFADVMLLGPNTNELPLIYFGGNSMDTIPDLIFSLRSPNANGTGVGDINGDGISDFCLTLDYPYVGLKDAIFFGGVDIDTIPNSFLQNRFGNDWSSNYITSGDFNGDGISDIVCGTGDPYLGDITYIYLGSHQFNPVPDAVTIGPPIWFEYGRRIATGDIDADGRDELIVGALNYPEPYVGRVYIYDGPQTWIDYGAQSAPTEELQYKPGWCQLGQNFPNPFNSTTSIHFDLGKSSLVKLKIYDLQGNEIKNLINDQQMLTGGYNISWSGRNKSEQPVCSGIYLLELQVDQYREFRKMVLAR